MATTRDDSIREPNPTKPRRRNVVDDHGQLSLGCFMTPRIGVVAGVLIGDLAGSEPVVLEQAESQSIATQEQVQQVAVVLLLNG